MKSSERFKRRYVSFLLAVDGMPPSLPQARKIIHEHFLAFFGESGIASLAFKLMEYDEKKGRGVVRMARERVDEAIFCMALLCELDGKPCRLESISTSGSLRRA